MSSVTSRRHGLEAFLETAPRGTDRGVTVRIQSGLAFVNLRGNATDATFTGTIGEVLGQPLPTTPNTFTHGDHRAYWLGPDEWLVVSENATGDELAARLERGVDGRHAAVNDVSGGNVGLIVAGGFADTVLAKGCTLDLHPDVFEVTQCAQSGLGRASVLLGKMGHSPTDDGPTFEIVVRRSYSDYLCRWLERSARSFGVAFPID